MESTFELLVNYMKCPYDYPFDLGQQPDKFGYFEVIIGKDGTVYEAPNGHQRGVVMMIARDKGITAEEVENTADVAYYIEWLLKESQAVMVWHEFYMGYVNEAQRKTIDYLKEAEFMSKNARERQPAY